MAAPKTVLTYSLNGTLKDFAIPFEYLARKFVVVTLIGATRRVLVLNSEYRFTGKKQITTTTAWGPAQGFDLIEIRRVTSATERLVDFSDGSILRAYDLNTAQVQSLHIAEEARDLTADTIGVNNEGNLDARGRRIVNLADAVNPGDAVTLRQEQAWSLSALNSANASANSANTSQAARLASEAARDLSQGHANASQTSRFASEAARNLSQQYRDASEAARNLSQQYRDASEAARNLSQQYRDASGSSATLSEASRQESLRQADRSKSEADRAQGAASGVSLPNAASKQGQVLRQKADGTGFEYVWGLETIKTQMLGTVSQVGGVPTGSIFETGYSGNQTWVKYANGTMILTITPIPMWDTQAPLAAVFYTGSFTITFAVPFAYAPAVSHTVINGHGFSWSGQGALGTTNLGTSVCGFSAGAYTEKMQISLIAIGRWF